MTYSPSLVYMLIFPSQTEHVLRVQTATLEGRKVSRSNECHFQAWPLKPCMLPHTHSRFSAVLSAKIRVALKAICWELQSLSAKVAE